MYRQKGPVSYCDVIGTFLGFCFNSAWFINRFLLQPIFLVWKPQILLGIHPTGGRSVCSVMTENLSSSRDQTTDRISKQQRRSNKGLLNRVLCCFVKRGAESRSNLQQLRHPIILRAIPPRCPFVFRQGLNTFTKRNISVSEDFIFFHHFEGCHIFLDLKITSNRTFLWRTYIYVGKSHRMLIVGWNMLPCYEIKLLAVTIFCINCSLKYLS